MGSIGFVAPCPIVNRKTEKQTLNVLINNLVFGTVLITFKTHT
tara:strand:- start:180 stop:308 length:129 start_codon:yes stop_codon:yes gene_type:complete